MRSTTTRVLIVAGASAATLAACGGGGSGSEETVQLQTAVINAETVPNVQCGFLAMEEHEGLLEAGIETSTSLAGELGTEDELLQQAADGQIDIAAGVTSIMASTYGIPEFEMFESYYLYDEVEDLVTARETPTMVGLFEQLEEEAGVRVLGSKPFIYGMRHVYGTKPIAAPEDFSGVKFRVPETPMSIKSAQALGANPTPITYTELFVALQQGVVDAAEAPLAVIKAESFDEATDHVSLTGHLLTAIHPLINADTYHSLTTEQQEALDSAVDELADEVAACVEEADQAAVDEWESEGSMTVVEDVDRDAMREAVVETYLNDFEWSEQYAQLLEEMEG